MKPDFRASKWLCIAPFLMAFSWLDGAWMPGTPGSLSLSTLASSQQSISPLAAFGAPLNTGISAAQAKPFYLEPVYPVPNTSPPGTVGDKWFEAVLHGEPRKMYYLEISTNLVDWQEWTASAISDVGGTARFPYFLPSSSKCLFIRGKTL